MWEHSVATGEPFQFEQRFRRADGEYRWHISRAAAMKNDAGDVLMWIGSNTDIHEQREAANELRSLASRPGRIGPAQGRVPCRARARTA